MRSVKGVRAYRRAGAGLAAVALVVGLAVVGGSKSEPAADATFGAASLPQIPQVTEDQPRERPVPRASRNSIRSKGPHQLPPIEMQNATCTLTMPQGTWKLDVVAARTLAMLTAVAYREDRPVAKAARAFEHSLHLQRRYVPRPLQAREMLRRNEYKKGGLTPHTWAVDAVLAMYSPSALTCTHPIRSMPVEEMLTNGLTMRAQTMVFGFWDSYGGRPLGGFDPKGITSGHIENSAHYGGRAVDIFFSRSDKDNNARGWLLANWLVANADYYSIATVIFDDRVWTLVKSAEGWRPYVHPSGDRKHPTLRHLDHIHADVINGQPKDTENAATEADVARATPTATRAAAPTSTHRKQTAAKSTKPDAGQAKSAATKPARPAEPATPAPERRSAPSGVLAPLPKSQPGPPTQ